MTIWDFADKHFAWLFIVALLLIASIPCGGARRRAYDDYIARKRGPKE